ncbi:MAG TPA: DUF6519 domain-containing protein [Kofleriaceae bacterium]|nr:DUF6519 domain-containing protein [Kofleriaceae bacterium]
MKADLTRRTHQPPKRYARVIHQQGRVPLDADLNEQFEIQHHLDAVRTRDAIGAAGVPKGPSFQVSVSPDHKDLLLGPGTAYVGGVLCETDGAMVSAQLTPPNVLALGALTLDARPLAPAEWVEVSSPTTALIYRIRAVDRVNRRITLGPTDNLATDFPGSPALRLRRCPSYLSQPDWPRPVGTTWPVPVNPDALTEAELPSIDPAKLVAGTYQVYLDVWERHITPIEDPSIVETALGGPDTCTRAKTVWQLKLRTLPGTGVDCSIPPELPAGALRARARMPSTGSSPCVIAPGASYRRLENQLYRVEIHGGGTLTGGAPSKGLTFKYSRDNGSVVVSWSGSVSSTELTVDTVGRDAVLGLASGQWIELLDDRCELDGVPGTLVQIDTVIGTTVKIRPLTATGSTELSAFLGAPRIRRWDHVGSAAFDVKRDAAVNDGYIELDDLEGVQILFEDGTYRTGDYWTIPARTITADVEWPLDLDHTPVSRPAEGIVHHRAALAQLTWSGSAWSAVLDASGAPVDCRAQFPPLTHICAEDVCVDPDPCGMGVRTVQEALEKLCEQQDLPFHNQHLHGWGVVCGLQVNCFAIDSPDPDARKKVILRTGYALHPSGKDIKLDKELEYPVAQRAMSLVPKDKTLDDIAVSLWLDLDGSIQLEPYDPARKRTARDLLDGTILLDFFDDCIKPVIDFWHDQTTPQPEDSSDLVAPSRKRVTTLVNLLMQFIDGQNGAFIYLSGEKDPRAEGANHEDRILREFFVGLRAKLQSKTFCAQYEGIEFPAYDVYRTNPDLSPTTIAHPFTIFGKNSHTRLRVHPDGRWGCTCNSAANVPKLPLINSQNLTPGPTKINVFDLDAGKLVAEVEFPISGAEVQDVAFNPGTSQIYAVAWIGDAKTDSAIVRGTIGADGTITWAQNQVTCSKKIVTLASGKEPTNKLYAAARGSGIFVFDMNALDPNPPQIGAETQATGHLVLVSRNRRDAGGNEGSGAGAILYAGFHSKTPNPVAYDHIVGIELTPDGSVGTTRTFKLGTTDALKDEGHDDIAGLYETSGATGEARSELYVVVEGNTGFDKALVTFDGNTTQPIAQVSLNENTENRIAYNWRTQQIFVTYEDHYKGHQYSPLARPPVLHTEPHPLQIGAIAVAAGPRGQRWYVLNWISDTITSIPARYEVLRDGPVIQPWESVIDVNKLAAYRDAVIVAFLKMLGRFLQYLKDCFCHHLLVDCPDGTGKIYLADVSFQDGRVYQICNFSRRRYVHSFPTVEYWLSVIPIVPVLKLAVEKFCCSVLTGFFDNLKPPSRERQIAIRPSIARSSMQWGTALNLGTALNTRISQLRHVGSLGRTVLTEKLSRPPSGTAPEATVGLAQTELIGQPARSVTEAAKRRGIEVNEVVVAEDLPAAARVLGATALATGRLAPGTKVDLITDRAGRVLGVRVAPAAITPAPTRIAAPPGEVAATRADVERLLSEIATLRAEVEQLKAAPR